MCDEFTRVAAAELGPAVRVNGVAPGAILPPVKLNDGDDGGRPASRDVTYPHTPDDVALAVVNLLQSTTLTGEIITVE